MESSGFYTHLQDAIEVNKQRANVYAQSTGNQSTLISHWMIKSEQMLLPAARYFDWKGKPFNRMGIPIIVNDFVSMENIKHEQESPTYNRVVGKPELNRLKQTIKNYNKVVCSNLKHAQFESLCQETENALEQISSVEFENKAHFAMLKHLLESIGYSAVNAIDYSASSNGETASLSSRLIRFQLLGLSTAILIDKAAQKIHQLDVGIIVNDVPDIPFLPHWHNCKLSDYHSEDQQQQASSF